MGEMDRTFNVKFLKEKEFDGIVELGNRIFGDNYLTPEELESIHRKSIKEGRNCSFTLTVNEGDGKERLIGFRLTYAPGQWIDSYPYALSPEGWGFDPDKVAYMKSNALDEEFRGLGLGRMLLDRAIAATKKLGAEAAVAHIWMNSPGNSAYNYFTRAGGREVKVYPAYWENLHGDTVPCIHCGPECVCPAAEMILDFSTHKELGHV